jgi:putative membrane protein
VSDSETVDASRRTRLAAERTFLAWGRSGLTALAVSLGAGKLLPEVTTGPRWPYDVLGVGYAALGILFLGYGYRRQTVVDNALARGKYAPLSRRFSLLITVFGIGLGVATAALIIFSGR